ncbi:holin [Dehalococcoides mccartyi CG1]|nr:holin [Dehalococcoides mccartyi CG1]
MCGILWFSFIAIPDIVYQVLQIFKVSCLFGVESNAVFVMYCVPHAAFGLMTTGKDKLNIAVGNGAWPLELDTG